MISILQNIQNNFRKLTCTISKCDYRYKDFLNLYKMRKEILLSLNNFFSKSDIGVEGHRKISRKNSRNKELTGNRIFSSASRIYCIFAF